MRCGDSKINRGIKILYCHPTRGRTGCCSSVSMTDHPNPFTGFDWQLHSMNTRQEEKMRTPRPLVCRTLIVPCIQLGPVKVMGISGAGTSWLPAESGNGHLGSANHLPSPVPKGPHGKQRRAGQGSLGPSLHTVREPGPQPRPLSVQCTRVTQTQALCVCVFNRSVVSDSLRPQTVTCQAPLSMRFSRQEYWSGLPLLPPGDLSDFTKQFGAGGHWGEPQGHGTQHVHTGHP